MHFRPPKGVRPPQLEGKRTGRPKGSKNWATVKRDVLWALENLGFNDERPPSPGAALWQRFAQQYPDEVEEFLWRLGWLD